MFQKSHVFVMLMFSVAPAMCQVLQDYEQPLPGSSLTLAMKAIPGGEWTWKASSGQTAKKRLSPFWIGTYEVTHDQFALFFRDEQISQGSKTDAVTRPTAQYIDLSWNMGKEGGFPVNSMSQDAALMFCRWLYRKTGVFYRLPSEAEWEYACRAGTNGPYFFGSDSAKLEQFAWYWKNSSDKYQRVGSRKPNPWGLYDMLGNVAEWTMDQYEEDYMTAVALMESDPLVPPAGRYPRTVRGGSFQDPAQDLQAGSRRGSNPSWNRRDPQVPKSRWWLTDAAFVGFRILRPSVQPDSIQVEQFYNRYLRQ